MASETINSIFKKVGVRLTPKRQNVYSILQNTKIPLTAEDIYQNYLNNDKHINLSTIYRILDLFTKIEIVNKMTITNTNKAFYTLNQGHTHYLICTSCQKFIEIDHCPFQNFTNNLEETTKFKITEHKLELYGLCPNCH